MEKRGFVQIYTGDGKGKTTASLGLAVRAAGAGLRVLFYQFLKPSSLDLSERRAIASSGLNITLDALDVDWDMYRSFSDPEILEKTRHQIDLSLVRLAGLASEGKYDMIVLDELVFCQSRELASIESIKKLLDRRQPGIEIVMTGRGATSQLVELADLVSEIREVKHPYQHGVTARKGIEY